MDVTAIWVRLYANLIENKRWTIEQVPAQYKDAVQAELKLLSDKTK